MVPDQSADGAGLGEAYWRGRADAQRRQIHDTEVRVAQIEEKIAGLRNDLTPTNVADPNREQTRQAAIAAAVQELEVTKQQLDAARKGMDDLEEEARRKSVPPGWLRER